MKIARRTFRVEVPSVAMGDIAFNLLVFFVILAKAQDDSHLEWKPASTPKVEKSATPRASIVIDINNDLYLNGQEIGISQLAKAVEDLLGKSPPGKRA